MMTRHLASATHSSAVYFVAIVMAFVVAGCGSAMQAGADPGGVSPAPSANTGAINSGPASSEPSTAASRSPSAAASSSHPEISPSGSAIPAPPRTAFAMNLYRRGDYVAQYTLEWCVGASLQMALNMTTAKDDTSRDFQQRLWTMAQARSSSPFGGANPRGWTAALNDLGIGPYELVSIPGFDEALRVAATAIRETRRPVGLVMWRGRHAWVMSGFESIGDPSVHDDATVTGVRVLDPLYPNRSQTWGPSPKPNALITPATLAKQFVIRDHGRVDLGVPPGDLLILPTTPAVGGAAD
jgi:hypothetical protein